MNTHALASNISRRGVLRASAAAAVAAGSALWATRALSQSRPRKLNFAWNANAFCLTPVPVAVERGFFEQNGLQVDLINYVGSTDQLLESLATGKADAAVGMVHRWLKPLETGFDVKIVGSSHGGCERIIGAKAAGATDLQKLKGKTIGVSDMSGPGKNFFSILLKKNGIDPDKEVNWRQYPGDLLDAAIGKGEIQAIADSDPLLYLFEKRNPGRYLEIATNLSGEYKDKTCCVVGVRGALVRDERPVVASLVRAIVQASDYVAENPNDSAKLYAKYSPKVPVEDLQMLLGTLTHRNHPLGRKLRDELEFYARDFKQAGVLKQSTDPARFADHITVDVLS